MEIKNRIAPDLNRKIFEVEKVTRDQAGEILQIVGKLIRADHPTEEGTRLDETTLTFLINGYRLLTKPEVNIIADGSSLMDGYVDIETARPLNVQIENQHEDLFEVSPDYKFELSKIMRIYVKAKSLLNEAGVGANVYEFLVVLTAPDKSECGRIVVKVYNHFSSTNPQD